jgi:hypothetical protein
MPTKVSKSKSFEPVPQCASRLTVARTPAVSLSWVVAGTVLATLPPGCGTDAVAVDDCREIENARCEAASHCSDRYTVTDVDACRRFYRDQCLHGIASSKPPSTGQVRACVSVIQAAGRCASATSATTVLAECGDTALAAQTHPTLLVACDVVAYPELAAECSFLSEVSELGTDSGAEATQGGADSGVADPGAADSGTEASSE